MIAGQDVWDESWCKHRDTNWRREKRELGQRNYLTIKNDHKKAMLEEGSGMVHEQTRLGFLLGADRRLKGN
jgi:hypothetical protein